ncbi:hypothetical protein ACFVMB_37325, partial [Streptomyces rochei]
PPAAGAPGVLPARLPGPAALGRIADALAGAAPVPPATAAPSGTTTAGGTTTPSGTTTAGAA